MHTFAGTLTCMHPYVAAVADDVLGATGLNSLRCTTAIYIPLRRSQPLTLRRDAI